MPAEPPLPELKVLRRNDAIGDEDKWPQFEVRNAEVKDVGGQITSLFTASPDNPVTLTGTLNTSIRPDRVLTAHKGKARIPIVVRNVTYFAYGVYSEGSYDIWAAGEAGWHAIQPSQPYRKTYNHMVEALSLLYFLVECYENGAKMPYDQVFLRYGQSKGLLKVEAHEKFYSHAQFLAARMLKIEEGIKWGATSFYQHLRKAVPSAFEPPTATASSRPALLKQQDPPTPPQNPAISRNTTTRTRSSSGTPNSMAASARSTNTRMSNRERTRPQATDAPPKRATRSIEPSRSLLAQTSTSEKKRVGRPRKLSAQEPEVKAPPTLSEMDKSRAREIWKFMQRKSNETLPEIAEMTVETFARFLHQEYLFQDEKEARYLLMYLAPDLVGMMSIPRNRSYDPWTELPVYDELMEAKVPGRVKGRIAAMQLKKRDTPLPGLEDGSEASDEDSSEESIIDEKEVMSRSRRRISALRPKSASKYSAKAAKRKGKEKATSETEEDEEMLDADANMDDIVSPGTPSKRPRISSSGDDDEGEETDSPVYPNKRFTRSRGDVDPELADLEFEAQQARSTGLAIRRKASIPSTNGHAPSSQATRMALVSEPAPSTEANAPGDIWNCPHMGCVHKVYGASEYASKDLIREHMLDHKDKERTDLLRDEESMTRLPVSHLLKKIREMAERAEGPQLKQLENGMMGLFPASLQRKVY